MFNILAASSGWESTLILVYRCLPDNLLLRESSARTCLEGFLHFI